MPKYHYTRKKPFKLPTLEQMQNEKVKLQQYLTLEPYFSKQRAKQGVKMLRDICSKIKNKAIDQAMLHKWWCIGIFNVEWDTNTNKDLPDTIMYTTNPMTKKPKTTNIREELTSAIERDYGTKVKWFDFDAMSIAEYQYLYYSINYQKTLTVLIPRKGLTNDIVFKYDRQLGEILDNIGCKWYGGGMMLTEGEGYRDMTFNISDDLNEKLVAAAISEFNKQHNIEVEFHFHDPKQ